MRHTILLITPFAPVRDGRHGSARVIHGLADAMADRHDLVVAHADAEHDVDPDLARRCVAVHKLDVARTSIWARRSAAAVGLVRRRSRWTADFRIRRLRLTIRELVRRYEPDVLQIEHGALLGGALRFRGPSLLRVVTIHDPAPCRDSEERRAIRGVLRRLDIAAKFRQERAVLASVDAAVVFSDRDRDLVVRRAPEDVEVVTVPLGWSVPAAALDPIGSAPPTLLFVGNFMHPPNVEAAIRLVTRILPLVHTTHEDVKVEIVGASASDEVLALAQDGVHVTGGVESVVPFLDRAAVVLAPVTTGGGTRVKVLEAMSYGKAVVSTVRGAAGIAADGDALSIADGDEAFAAAVIRLLSDERARRRLAENARAWALRELRWSTTAARYEDLYDRLAEGRPKDNVQRITNDSAER